jgi:hypothetical protein
MSRSSVLKVQKSPTRYLRPRMAGAGSMAPACDYLSAGLSAGSKARLGTGLEDRAFNRHARRVSRTKNCIDFPGRWPGLEQQLWLVAHE